MKKIGYWIAKVKSKLFHSHEIMVDYYRRGGVKIGQHCLICSDVLTRESCLIEIGDETVISTDVSFVTHDNSAKLIFGNRGDLFGRIVIGSHCFIGERAIIMYGVSLGNNIIVASGSVVTKSFETPDIIIGGNPAKIIGSWENYKRKYNKNAIARSEMQKRIKKDESFLVRK